LASSRRVVLAPADRLAYLRELITELDARAAAQIRAGTGRAWHDLARPKQLPPHHPRHHLPDANGYSCGCAGGDTDYEVFLFCAGRGVGKSLAGANNIVDMALEGCPVVPGGRCRDCPHTFLVSAPTHSDVKNTCFGAILANLANDEMVACNRSELIITLRNGNMIRGISADNPERYRGPNLSGAWVDELGSFRYEDAWHQMRFALRIGRRPRIYVTTTPRPTRLIRELFGRDDGSVHVTTGSTRENAANLSAVALAELERQYAGTRLGRQELEGELLEDIEGALWSRGDIDTTRVRMDEVPELARIVVAIDPAVTSGEDSDETGIIVAGEGRNQEGYVLADLTMRGTPDACMRKAVSAWYQYEADCVVAEVNNGGDYVRDLLRTVDPQVPYKSVRASRGKRTRAEPVSALYEQHRIHHIGAFPDLEDQMCQFVTGVDGGHDDRVDALVWAFFELKGIAAGSWTGAYGVVYCESCSQPFLPAGREKCPHCQAPLPADDDERGLGEAA
jgi:predicted phage terminase large subunit-like protein